MGIMMDEPSEPKTDQTRKAVAILVACIVQTLAEADATLQKTFLAKLEKVHQDVRDQMGTDCLETLTWVRKILAADDFRSILHH